MKRHLAFIPLSREHQDGLILATRLQQGRKALLRLWSHDLNWQAEYVVKFYDDSLSTHFDVEEKLVFPLAQIYFGEKAKIVQRLYEEHSSMKSMVESFPRPNQKILGENLTNFGKLLEAHIHCEERDFFPFCEKIIPEEKLNELGSKIKQFKDGKR